MSTISKMAGDALGMESQYRTTKALLDASIASGLDKDAEIARLHSQIAAHKATIKQAEDAAHQHEIIRSDLLLITFV